ncbi:MAG: hypothetical protein HGA94_03665, partial [Candidatus Aminicenantes bacterium]|nr:hypothetical protein [Candidatus Aminicenantes bacterium]
MLILTSNRHADMAQACIAAGAKEVLHKPILQDDLLATSFATQPLLDNRPLIKVLRKQNAWRHLGRLVVELLDEG